MKKNFSRTLAALLAAAMLMCILPAAVFAAPDSSLKTIPEVTLEDVTPPQVFEYVYDPENPEIHVPEGAHYELVPYEEGPVQWAGTDLNGKLYGKAYFEAGESYRIRVTYMAKEGYEFVEGTTKVPALPGTTVTFSNFFEEDGVSYLRVMYDYGILHAGNKGDQPIWEVNANIKLPSFGQSTEDLKPFVTLPEGETASYTATAAWHSNEDKDFGENHLFNMRDGCYSCKMEFTAKDGWYFPDHLNLKIDPDGDYAKRFPEASHKTMTVYYDFQLTVGEDEWILTFDTNGGKMAMNNITGQEAGAVVDLTKFVPTREGYTFVGWCSDFQLQNVITSITMTGSTTVYAKWISNTEGIDASDKFTDIPADAWYHEAVNFVFHRGYFGGTGDRTFEPETPMTRAMLVTVLWRYEGSPEDGGDIFTDVPPEGQWYSVPVAWAAKNKIVNGIGGGKFDPEGNITREQMAAILYRYAEWKGYKISAQAELNFPDAGRVSGWAEKAVKWAVAEGFIGGSDGKLLPDGNATRAQVAAILMRFDKFVHP